MNAAPRRVPDGLSKTRVPGPWLRERRLSVCRRDGLEDERRPCSFTRPALPRAAIAVVAAPTDCEHHAVMTRPRQGTARASASRVELIPDERIGNYRIVCEREATGTGRLYEAQHLIVPRRAIIKITRTGRAMDQSRVVQALREASILESIAHPGVPIVYEAGCTRDLEPWFAFEANTGPTLEVLLGSGPFPVVAVAALLRDIADILEHAHARGVIHRGLRPSRIVISTGGRYPLCISDWSDAIVHDAATQVLPAISDASRSYVAPELLR